MQRTEIGQHINNRPELRLTSPLTIGEWVMVLQDRLLRLGLMKASDVDGFFGEHTSRRLRVFQTRRRIPVTGMTDPRTWEELDKAIGELK